MTLCPEPAPDSIETLNGATTSPGEQVDPATSGGTRQMPQTRGGIDLAFQQIARRWRDTPRRQPLITQLTALDWQVRCLDRQHPSDAELIRRISELRSQIWLSSEQR